MGRPRKFDPNKLAAQINEYVDTHELPLISTMCVDIGISKDRLYKLRKECDALDDSIKKANAKCESLILQRGLTGRYNGAMSIFLLKNYGWTDKQEEDVDKSIKVDMSSVEEYSN